MKTVDLPQAPLAVTELLEQARQDDLIVRLADGSEFLLVAIDEFDREIARSRNNPKLMALLEARARQSSTLPFDEVKRKLGLDEKCERIRVVCDALANKDRSSAIELLREYPRAPAPARRGVRSYGKVTMTRVFIRDGFVDRYTVTGTRLVYPPALRLLWLILQEEFPYHPNWKTTNTHPAFWELQATIDHKDPVTLGGRNENHNLVTTSMARNSAKMNYSLNDLGWPLRDPGRFEDWDGLLHWFLRYPAREAGLLEDERVARWYHTWHRAARLAIAGH
jgi:hypothetical protein